MVELVTISPETVACSSRSRWWKVSQQCQPAGLNLLQRRKDHIAVVSSGITWFEIFRRIELAASLEEIWLPSPRLVNCIQRMIGNVCSRAGDVFDR